MVDTKKCLTPGCYMRAKLTKRGLALLRSESRRVGRPAGLLCPKCVTRAFDDTEKYSLNIPLGDVLVESMQAKPNWYVAFPPVGGGKESGTGGE